MSSSRYTIIGLSPPRADWADRVTGWATEATLPIEFTKVLSASELASRLLNGLRPSAVLVDEHSNGVDRDLIDAATRAGAMVIVITGPAPRRDWARLGAPATLPTDFERHHLLTCIQHGAPRRTAAPLESVRSMIGDTPLHAPDAPTGRLLAVCGGGGTGASTIAQALAQGASAHPEYSDETCLVDLATRGHQALLHHTGDVLPGLQELVHAYRGTQLDPEQLTSFVWRLDHVAYDLVIGLRRTQDWTAITPTTFDAALHALLDRYRLVVADIDPEFDGEQETGSVDIEERNHRSRHAVDVAARVVVCGSATVKGFHDLVSLCDRLVRHGVTPEKLVRVVNFAPRSPRGRSRISAELARFDPDGARLATVFVERRPGIETCRQAGAPLPDALVRRIADTVIAIVDRHLDDRGGPARTGRDTAAALVDAP